MPGYGDYKKLYFEEFRTMKWEGYDVDKYVNDNVNDDNFMPSLENVEKHPQCDDFWQKPYENLVKIMDTPVSVYNFQVDELHTL